MTRRTVEVFECDVCGQPGDRYTVHYPEGALALDRCVEDAGAILALRNEEGGHWVANGPAKSTFRIASAEEIIQQQQASRTVRATKA
jgi:hypothetical protein